MTPPTVTPPTVLTIAGSDSSGAAGLQADLKTLEARGVYGLSALTLVTAQNSLGIQSMQALPLEMIGQQIDSVLTDIGADVVKTGLLLKADVIKLVAEKMVTYNISALIVDPVMVDGLGRRLITPDADRAYIDLLFPRALIVTPNLDEARLLTQQSLSTAGDMYVAAHTIQAMGPRYVLIKGGHAPDTDDVIDLLYDGVTFHEFRAPRIATWNARGTGCTFASAIAAEIAKGREMTVAVELAKHYVTEAIKSAAGWKLGAGRGTVNHAVGK